MLSVSRLSATGGALPLEHALKEALKSGKRENWESARTAVQELGSGYLLPAQNIFKEAAQAYLSGKNPKLDQLCNKLYASIGCALVSDEKALTPSTTTTSTTTKEDIDAWDFLTREMQKLNPSADKKSEQLKTLIQNNPKIFKYNKNNDHVRELWLLHDQAVEKLSARKNKDFKEREAKVLETFEKSFTDYVNDEKAPIEKFNEFLDLANPYRRVKKIFNKICAKKEKALEEEFLKCQTSDEKSSSQEAQVNYANKLLPIEAAYARIGRTDKFLELVSFETELNQSVFLKTGIDFNKFRELRDNQKTAIRQTLFSETTERILRNRIENFSSAEDNNYTLENFKTAFQSINDSHLGEYKYQESLKTARNLVSTEFTTHLAYLTSSKTIPDEKEISAFKRRFERLEDPEMFNSTLGNYKKDRLSTFITDLLTQALGFAADKHAPDILKKIESDTTLKNKLTPLRGSSIARFYPAENLSTAKKVFDDLLTIQKNLSVSSFDQSLNEAAGRVIRYREKLTEKKSKRTLSVLNEHLEKTLGKDGLLLDDYALIKCIKSHVDPTVLMDKTLQPVRKTTGLRK